MKFTNKLAMSSIPVLMVMANIASAEVCTSPCDVNAGENPQIHLNDTTVGNNQDWEIEARNDGSGNSVLLIGVDNVSNSVVIEDDAPNDTLVVDDNGRIGIGTRSPTEDLQIDDPLPGIRLNDTTGLQVDIQVSSNNFFIEDEAGFDQFVMELNGSNPNQLYLDSDGDVGIQVANPIADLHVGGSGEILLENGTNDWALEPNSTGLFFRRGDNTTNGDGPFAIYNGAPDVSLRIDDVGNIGMGTFTPDSALHIQKSAAAIHIEDTNATFGNRQLLELENNGGIGMRMRNTNANAVWDFNNTNSGNFTASKKNTGGFEFEVQGNGRMKVRSFGTLNFDMRADGNLHIPNGDVIVGGTTLNVPDYVFEHDYELMPLDELKGFVAKNKHLPNVPSEAEIKKSKQLSMAKFQMTHLEKIEELTLYTLQQHDQINSLESKLDVQTKALQETNVQMQKKLDEQNIALKTENGNLKERLASLEKLVTNLAMSSDKMGKGDKVAMK